MNPSWGKGNEWKKYADQVLGKDFFNDFKEFGLTNQGPLVNVYENSEEIYCLINLPGVKNIEDIHLYVHYRTLKVTSTIDFSIKKFNCVTEEIASGPIEREIPLPHPVEDRPLDAGYYRGLLYVRLQRLKQEKEQQKVKIYDYFE
ncbi:Hsp20/alpha crystallin family protein [Fictibacillus sp. KU28468]|uniref:Hsp20/alpha crystallin family protein n=1 Tax=Fictibacillus sp. KU28468 TaxID=2991053 RepID=UPI00223E498D|nr:Hsp20/alpha crystallin family protein [Fictibacillus sp. KU28468]UZJ78705.1 Hsp20/alpha crystallin family protein [Fictibacillus sp. KU28468]